MSLFYRFSLPSNFSSRTDGYTLLIIIPLPSCSLSSNSGSSIVVLLFHSILSPKMPTSSFHSVSHLSAIGCSLVAGPKDIHSTAIVQLFPCTVLIEHCLYPWYRSSQTQVNAQKTGRDLLTMWSFFTAWLPFVI